MKNWFLRGVAAGIRTDRHPVGDVPTSLSAGLPVATELQTEAETVDLVSLCPTCAITGDGAVARVNVERCVLCMRCRGNSGSAMEWRHGIEPARASNGVSSALGGRFTRSIHVRVIDAGDCGSCLNEIAQLGGPSYNLHRFGIFVTPTPRLADVLLVVGPVTRQMRDPLIVAYEAIPEPKRVVAAGACAASGGVFGPSLMCGAGAADAVPVDIVVPGCPPSPYAILDALRLVCGQKGRPT